MTGSLVTFLEKVDAALDVHVGDALFGLSDAELARAQVMAHRIGSRIDETELRLVQQAASRDADAKTRWVRSTQQTPRMCGARVRLAAALEERPVLAGAMAAGDCSEAQARVIVWALHRLPAGLDTAVVDQAEKHLVDLARDHHAEELRRLGRRLLEVVAPDLAEAHEAALVDAEHRRAMERCDLRLWDHYDGTWGVRGTLPDAHAHMLNKLLTTWSSPKRRRAFEGAGISGRAIGHRRGLALCELLERLPADLVPYSGGLSARVMVDITLDDLTMRLTEAGVATIDGMVDIPAWEARRMACEAGLIPAVLGGKSEVLDLGRSQRLHNEPQRQVIFRRDQTCRAEGCDWPAHMGHVHHPQPWSRGGPTDLTGMALCPQHHTRAHDPTYEMRTTKHGKVVFLRR